MNDPISRQDAIDELLAMLNSDYLDGYKYLEKLKRLPSAQPEIIHCRECKHWEQESICDGYCSEIEKDGFDEDHFCSYAERQEE